MTDLRSSLDISRRLLLTTEDRFDAFTVLEASPRFASYTKTVEGLSLFFRTELPHHCVRLADDKHGIVVHYGVVWIHVAPLDFLRMLFLPLFHCSWDANSMILRDNVLAGELTDSVHTFLYSLFTPKITTTTSGVRLEDVPDDWRDLLLDYIKKGAVDLSKYNSLQALEHRVDQLEGLLEPDDSPQLRPQLLPFLDDPPLPQEERVVLAKTLRLDPNDFRTKREAMDLYAEANQ